MGYNFHITRRVIWSDEGNDITSDEWLALVSSDPELHLQPENGPFFAIWTAAYSFVPYWLNWENGQIETKNPDDLLIDKMVNISHKLHAVLQGDEGETYHHSVEVHKGKKLSRPVWYTNKKITPWHTKIDRTFTVKLDATTAYKRVKIYFTQKGYKQYFKPMGQDIENIQALAFKRGSGWKSFFYINPEKWGCQAMIKIIPSFSPTSKWVSVKVLLNVNNADNRTKFTDKFWESEIDELGKILTQSDYVPLKNEKLNQKAFAVFFYYLMIGLASVIAYFGIWIITELIFNHFFSKSNLGVIIGFVTSTVLAILIIFMIILKKRRINSG
jgi:hypothetical protein